MALMERETQLAQLADHCHRAIRGEGRLVALHGEAGAGKTSLLQHFLATLSPTVLKLVGGCEPLFTARPFGPLLDFADELPLALSVALREARRDPTLFVDLLSFLRKPLMPKVLVIDDLHWADAGTLDLVRYVARRLAHAPVLFIVTYRGEDLGADHPVRHLLGDLPSATTLRMTVPCLSREAVAALAGPSHRNAADLYDITGGNPFFVTEVLNSPAAAVPPSVFDAMMSRLSRVSPAARALAELAAASPTRIERAVVEDLIGFNNDSNGSGKLIDECVDKGLLQVREGWIAFRHELARMAIEQSLSPGRFAELHRQIFSSLNRDQIRIGHQSHLSRLVHHAHGGGLRAEVLTLAPRAARAASRVSAHQEAAKLYKLAIEYAPELPQDALAEMLESAAEEYRLVSDWDADYAATKRALAIRKALHDPLREAMNLRHLAGVLWRERDQRAEAHAAIVQAITILEKIPPSVELVRAYAELARLHTSWSQYEKSVEVGERAVALAESFDDARCLIEALHACSAAKMYLRDDREARAQLERALAIALHENLEDAAAHLFATLQVVSLIYRDHLYAIDVAERGLAYCEARDLDSFVLRLLDNRALSLTELGRWEEADHTIARCLAEPNISRRLRNSLMFLQAWQDARRGKEGVNAYWMELQKDLDTIRMGYRKAGIANAAAEAAWLRRDITAAQHVIGDGIAAALENSDGRLLAPMLVWAKRCGVTVPDHNVPIGGPHRLELDGDITAAANAWGRLHCRYDRALTLMHGTEAQIREALQELDLLGAKPAAEIAHSRLRATGARGPQPRTRADPLRLTARERQVYELLLKSRSNVQIAQSLNRSERTVENHVARVLNKLGVKSRSELGAVVKNAAEESSGKN
jgi:DNA-binding CsgD family transcriptional regulator/tetratricopeptide (TPR) repeat protein